MWNGFMGQTIASTTRTLRTIGKIFLILALVIVLYSSKSILNIAVGPAQLGEKQLLAITDPRWTLRDYATVRGTETDRSGVEALQQTTRNGVVESEEVIGEYMMTHVGMHVLIVKSKPKELLEIYTGKIVALPAVLKGRILSGRRDSAELEAMTFPLMLDASKVYADDDFWSGLMVAGIFAFFAIRLFYLYQKRTNSPETHPLARAIAKYGSIYSLVPQIDAEMGAGSSSLLGVRMTANWLINCTVTNSSVMRRDEIVWAYKKQTSHSVHFIPTGSSHSSVLRDSRGNTFEISATDEKQAAQFLNVILERSPGAVLGYDKKLERLYKKSHAEFITLMAQRKV